MMNTVTVSVKTCAMLDFYENLIILYYMWIIKNNKIVIISRHVLNIYYIPDILLSTLNVFRHLILKVFFFHFTGDETETQRG